MCVCVYIYLRVYIYICICICVYSYVQVKDSKDSPGVKDAKESRPPLPLSTTARKPK